MNSSGIVFDIKEFALYDGPGLRCTVFFKGCPLCCSWCHNPEGINPAPETMSTAAGSRTAGRAWEAEELAEKLLSYAPVFKGTEGGITLSGGEPLFQAPFVRNLMALLKGKLHLLLQTSGYAPEDEFAKTAALSDLVFFDFKLADPDAHKRFTGKDNRIILNNLKVLDASGLPYRIRFPLIPGVTDTEENYQGIRSFITQFLGKSKEKGKNLLGLDLLAYNPAAGGKYKALGREYKPGFDEKKPPDIRPGFFGDLTEVNVL
jgi:pyruvate formate lyase activating enzyme